MTPLSNGIQPIAVRKCCELCIYFSTCIPLQNDQLIIYQPREGKPAVWEDPHIQNCANYLHEDKTKQGRQNRREPDLCKTVRIVEK